MIWLPLAACVHRAPAPIAPPVATALPGPTGYHPLIPVAVAPTERARLGSDTAPWVILEFSDFECPHCAATYLKLSGYVAQRPDVKLIYRDYPISNQCNPRVDAVRHEHACAAARAGLCADQQGRFDALARKMFANQAYLADTDLALMAAAADLDVDAFGRCVVSADTNAALLREVEQGINTGILGTPTLYVWGPWGPTWTRVDDADGVIAAIDAAIDHQSLAAPEADRAY